jgi:hypothetical protein
MASTLSCAHAGSSTTEALGAIPTDSQPLKHARRLAHAVTNVRVTNCTDLFCLNNVIWGRLQHVILSVRLCHQMTLCILNDYKKYFQFLLNFDDCSITVDTIQCAKTVMS